MRSILTVRSLVALTVLATVTAGGWMPLCAQNRRMRYYAIRAQAAEPRGHAEPRGQDQREQNQREQDQRGAGGEVPRLGAIQRRQNPGGPRGEHLAQWMSQHSNLTPAQQQQALDQEPGFRDLPQATQQRYHDRLAQLNAMPPQVRQRILAHTEAMEHMSPAQRADFRGVMQQLGSLPLDQRRMVARTFRQLRDLPPDQRYAALNSDRFRGQFNDAQRATLNNLLRIEPLMPPPEGAPR